MSPADEPDPGATRRLATSAVTDAGMYIHLHYSSALGWERVFIDQQWPKFQLYGFRREVASVLLRRAERAARRRRPPEGRQRQGGKESEKWKGIYNLRYVDIYIGRYCRYVQCRPWHSFASMHYHTLRLCIAIRHRQLREFSASGPFSLQPLLHT